MVKTLIVLDVQNDFMPGGALAVAQGDRIVPIINALQPKFDLVVATQDWHPANHKSFASNHPHKQVADKITLGGIEQLLWPDHCVQGSEGAQFHPGLDTRPFEAIFRKGIHAEIDSYSGFYDNKRQKTTGLAGFLREKKAKTLYFCGLCGDFCVYYSIKDALLEGFDCVLIEEATAPLNQANFQGIKAELRQQGVRLMRSGGK
jgi:nicotinamidase/pyrazinamidase